MRLPLAIAVTMILVLPATAHASATNVAPRVRHAVPVADTVAGAAVRDAMRLRGAPYAWSGASPAGFDCSGFTSYVYGRLGIHLAHSSYAQWSAGPHVRRADLRPGDLVFFAGLGHVGIYIGGGRFIHAPHTGTVVSVDRLSGSWYGPQYDGAVRLRGSSRLLATMAAWRSRSTSRRNTAHVSPVASKLSILAGS
jgi:cell wall-associated NlpC family hydrolase